MDKKDRAVFLEACPDFFRDGVGGKYLDAKDSAEFRNKRNVQWLMEMRDVFKNDVKHRQKAESMLARHGVLDLDWGDYDSKRVPG